MTPHRSRGVVGSDGVRRYKREDGKPRRGPEAFPISKELIDEICDRIADGESLRSICEDDGMPDPKTVRSWYSGTRDIHHYFRQQYALARELQADAFVDEIVILVDKSRPENAQKTKLQLDARKWVASKQRPKKYGTSLALTGSDGGPLAIAPAVDLSGYTDEELGIMENIQRRVLERRKAARLPSGEEKGEVVEVEFAEES